MITTIDPVGRWCILREILGSDITIDKFADKVTAVFNEYYPGKDFTHFGDPAVVQVNDKSEKTSWDILASKGITIRHKPSTYRERKEIIEKKLATIISGQPELIVDPQCKVIIEGFLGGYHYPVHKAGQEYTDKFELPVKDGYYDHLLNSLEYIAVNMFKPMKSNFKRTRKKRGVV